MRPTNDNDAINLIFGGDLEIEEELSDIEDEIEELDATQRKERSERPSTYVRVMEDMINEVDSYERHLLSEDEWCLIRLLGKELKYHARYLLARLLCRKQNRWHSFNALHRYTSEIGEDGIRQAITDLSAALEPSEEAKVKVEEPEIIDLTLDEEEEEDRKPAAGPPAIPPPTRSKDAALEAVIQNLDLSFFCQDESTMTLHGILETLPADQLRALAKETRVSPKGTKKEHFIDALMKYSCTQASLPFESPKKNKSKDRERYDDGYRQTLLCFAVPCKETQEQRLKEMALKKLGKCIRLNYDFFRLVRRFSIIFYRSMHLPTDIFLPSLLSEFKKRIYPKYNATRTGQIWESRDAFLQYEEALHFEAELEAILESEGKELRASTTPKRGTATPGKTPRPCKADTDEEMDDVNDGEELSPQQMVAKAVREKVMNTILPRWRLCVAVKRAVKKEVLGEDPRPGLDRFEPGYIYTRMVEKYARALGQLKEYEAEVETLGELLDQRFWRRGKRGSWYDRRALVEITYLSKVEGKKSKSRPKLRIAMEHLKDALQDDDTHLICRPGLFRRLQKVEKTLKVPEEQRSQCEGELKEPEVVEVHAERIKRSSNSLQLDQFGRPKGKENGAPGSSRTKDGGKAPSWTGKSLWRGEQNEEVNVETRTLQAYGQWGYKGFHSETRILTTIFGLLFWDVIFADVPGAFETKFQTAPLDIAEDSFYYARKELIQTRLREIEDGKAAEILERHDRIYRPSKTWCVGVKWEYPREDVLEIVQCFKGESLATICHLFCEDYAGRSSGAPDLIVWKPEDRECKFVEVKGPGDRLQENQKLWCDALQRAGVEVHLCHVKDVYGKAKRINNKRKKNAKLEEESLSGLEDEDHQNIDEEAEYQPPAPVLGKRPADEEAEEHYPLSMSQPRTSTTATPTKWPATKVEVVITSPSPVKKRRKLDVVSTGS
ncbi:VRR-NUC domain-containing protein [Desarmillaria tabescens]|uniref:Fanconi-associated nuclease n=1 Tax=Armillaria tabescens TaxID=1929756 RepID=A0AA39T4B2_ARMTA|nr:VRR-NUC domain-containing protein [Desarmillaria tabescens]KAK0463511.1 VRR-NUC domain-containing protein [Desarmillaria tabescens]